MTRKVFFSFHYQSDNWRAANIRNSNVVVGIEKAGYVDSVDWEQIKRQGDDAIKRWIKFQLEGTSVTVVLIGSETSEREWVQYEISESYRRGNGLIGVYIHNVKNQNGATSYKGLNPFDRLTVDGHPFSKLFPTYDWVINDGRNNMGNWIEEAAQGAGR